MFCVDSLSLAHVTRRIPDIDTTLGESFDCVPPGVIARWSKGQVAIIRGAIKNILDSIA